MERGGPGARRVGLYDAREGRQTDLITIVNGINEISYGGQNEKDESSVRYRINESRIGICEIKMRLVTRSFRSRPRNDVRLVLLCSSRVKSGTLLQRVLLGLMEC